MQGTYYAIEEIHYAMGTFEMAQRSNATHETTIRQEEILFHNSPCASDARKIYAAADGERVERSYRI